MADGCQPCEQLSVPEQRPYQTKIVEVCAPVIGVVNKIGVALFQTFVLFGLVDYRLYREGPRANEDWQASRALPRWRRFARGKGHGKGDLDQSAIKNSKQNWIDRLHFRSGLFAPRRLPRSIISGVPINALSSLKSNIRSRKG